MLAPKDSNRAPWLDMPFCVITLYGLRLASDLQKKLIFVKDHACHMRSAWGAHSERTSLSRSWGLHNDSIAYQSLGILTTIHNCHGISASSRRMGAAGLPFGTGSAGPCTPQHSSCHPYCQEQLNPAPCQLHSCHRALGGEAYETILHYLGSSSVCWSMHPGL